MASSLLAGAVGSLLDFAQQQPAPILVRAIRGDDATEGLDLWQATLAGPTRMQLIGSDTFELTLDGELVDGGVTVEGLDGKLTLHVPSVWTAEVGQTRLEVTRLRSGLSLLVARGRLLVEAS